VRAGLTGAVLAAALAAASAAVAAAQAPPPPPAAGTTPLHAVIYEADILRTGPLAPELVQKLGPIHTLQGVEDLLKQNRIAFAWAHGEMKSGTMPADFAKQMDALPPGEVFVAQQGQGWVMGVITGKH
jgi:hypothetical protein